MEKNDRIFKMHNLLHNGSDRWRIKKEIRKKEGAGGEGRGVCSERSSILAQQRGNANAYRPYYARVNSKQIRDMEIFA